MTKPLIIITGASSGIGRSVARLLSSKGFPLLLVARRVELLKKLALPDTLYKEVDVSNLEQFDVAIEEAEKIYGPTNCLINNAGVMLLGAMETQSPNEWKKMIDVNIVGVMNGIHCVLKKMIQEKSGTIINIGSVAGRKTFPNHAAYCATKFGVHALSENIRSEVAQHNVRVITIAPGAVETELLSHTTNKKIIQAYEEWKNEMGPTLNPIDIANAVWYAYNQPQNICIRELVIAPTRQSM